MQSLVDVGVRCRRDGEVLHLTLCQPQRRNTQGPAMWHALADLGRSFPEGVKVCVLDAEGPSFSAGLDRGLLPGGPAADSADGLGWVVGADPSRLAAAVARYQEAFTWWHQVDAVTVAVVQGHAVGAGFQLALACDLRVCSWSATFRLAETRLGLVPDLGGVQRLTTCVGPARTLDLVATGRTVDAATAERWGIVSRVVDDVDLPSEAAELVRELLSASGDSLRAALAVARGAGSRTEDDQLRLEREVQSQLIGALRSPLA